MLAAGAHAFLDGHRFGRRRGLSAGEVGLERDHAGIDEQQGGVVLRDQRGRWNDKVIVGAEIAQELGANVVQAGHAGARTLLAVRVELRQ